MIKITINSEIFFLNEEISILEACELIGIKIPRFCYYQGLSIAGNCRMCLVYLEHKDKELLVVSCVTAISENMVIVCSGSGIEKARESVIEFLLLNHPLDCPICDQGGECDLQDQTKKFGGVHNRLFINKSTVEDKYFSPFIKSIMTRCIHCTRCVRFNSEIIGSHFFSTLNRGGSTEIGTYYPKIIDSEISGNVVDLCPVGALTTKTYAFKVRPWELRSVESIDLSDSLGSNIYVQYTEHEIQKVLPKLNLNINDFLISDKARFSYDAFKFVPDTSLIKEYYNSSVTNVSGSVLSKTDSYLKKIKNQFNTNEKKILLLSEETSFELLTLAQEISYKNESISVKLIQSKSSHCNNFFYNQENKLININTSECACFLFAINPRIEAALINTKLRLLELRKNYKIYNFGYKYNSYIKTNFINFDISEIFRFIEGKIKNLSFITIKTVKPLILFGISFIERVKNINFLKQYIKKINPSIVFFNIFLWSNACSVDFLGLKPSNRSSLKKANIILLKDSQDIYHNRKYIYSFFNQKKVISFESVNLTLNIKNGYVFYIKNFYEKNEIFINLEFRAQKTHAITKESKAFCIYSLFMYLFYSKQNNYSENIFFHSSFIFELSKSILLFNNFSKKKYTNFILLKNKMDKKLTKTTTYSIKPQYQCFYTTNYFSRFSINMLVGSRANQSTAHNFVQKRYKKRPVLKLLLIRLSLL